MFLQLHSSSANSELCSLVAMPSCDGFVFDEVKLNLLVILVVGFPADADSGARSCSRTQSRGGFHGRELVLVCFVDFYFSQQSSPLVTQKRSSASLLLRSLLTILKAPQLLQSRLL